jgi:hypothetical protein
VGDGVVVGQARVPEDSPPAADIDGLRVCRDGERDLLGASAVRDGSVSSRDRRDGQYKVDVSRLKLPDASRQPHGEVVISDGDEYTRAVDARHLRHRVSKPCRITE